MTMTTATLEPPKIYDGDAMLEFLIYSEDAPSEPTLDYLSTALLQVGRNDGPCILYSLYCEGLLGRRSASALVPDVWAMAEFPMAYLEPDDWRSLFRLAGYTYDMKRRARPRKPRQLYRGSDEAHRDGWSWTADRALAQWFADRPVHPTPGRVWTATVEPERMLARIASAVRPGEDEHVVDTDGLMITEARR